MTTPDPTAIEAGAQALCDSDDWQAQTADDQKYWRSCAQAAYTAMAPHIRKAVAEEIAREIEARRQALVQTDERAPAPAPDPSK